jgi:hypothetical protein
MDPLAPNREHDPPCCKYDLLQTHRYHLVRIANNKLSLPNRSLLLPLLLCLCGSGLGGSDGLPAWLARKGFRPFSSHDFDTKALMIWIIPRKVAVGQELSEYVVTSKIEDLVVAHRFQ